MCKDFLREMHNLYDQLIIDMVQWSYGSNLQSLIQWKGRFDKIIIESAEKGYQPSVFSYLFLFLWLSMVREERGPCDGGMTHCFFCTAMLCTEPGIPMLSLKNPLPFSPPPPLLNFYFKMPLGPRLSVLCMELPPASAACPSVPHK